MKTRRHFRLSIDARLGWKSSLQTQINLVFLSRPRKDADYLTRPKNSGCHAGVEQLVQQNCVTQPHRSHAVIGDDDQIDLAEDLAGSQATNQAADFFINFEHGLLRLL